MSLPRLQDAKMLSFQFEQLVFQNHFDHRIEMLLQSR